MRTTIIRTPFGMTESAAAARLYTEIDQWKQLRREFCRKHFADVTNAVEGTLNNPVAISSGYRHRDAFNGGTEGEWWTVICYDGMPER